MPCSLKFQAYIILCCSRWPISNAASIIIKYVAPSPASRRWLGLRETGAQWNAAFKKGWKKRLITEPSQCVIWKGARGWLPHNASFTLRIIRRRRKTKHSKKNLTVAVVFPFVFRYLKAISTGPPSTAIVLIKLSSSCDFWEAGISGFVSSKM